MSRIFRAAIIKYFTAFLGVFLPLIVYFRTTNCQFEQQQTRHVGVRKYIKEPWRSINGGRKYIWTKILSHLQSQSHRMNTMLFDGYKTTFWRNLLHMSSGQNDCRPHSKTAQNAFWSCRMSLSQSYPCHLHTQPADMICNMFMKTSKSSACSLRTGRSSRFATCSRQAVFKWSYEELVKSSEARWPLPRLMWRPSGSGAAGPTGRTTCHAATYTAKTAT
jgi:predicted SPOUT superfamily RNA methylase MTH1